MLAANAEPLASSFSNCQPHAGMQPQRLVCLGADQLVGLPEGYFGNRGEVRPDSGEVERAGYLAGHQLAPPYLHKHGPEDIVGGDPPSQSVNSRGCRRYLGLLGQQCLAVHAPACLQQGIDRDHCRELAVDPGEIRAHLPMPVVAGQQLPAVEQHIEAVLDLAAWPPGPSVDACLIRAIGTPLCSL